MDIEKIVERLYMLRVSKRMTQSEVAKEVGIATSTYAMYEAGKRIPRDEVKVKIAEFFGVTVQSLFFD